MSSALLFIDFSQSSSTFSPFDRSYTACEKPSRAVSCQPFSMICGRLLKAGSCRLIAVLLKGRRSEISTSLVQQDIGLLKRKPVFPQLTSLSSESSLELCSSRQNTHCLVLSQSCYLTSLVIKVLRAAPKYRCCLMIDTMLDSFNSLARPSSSPLLLGLTDILQHLKQLGMLSQIMSQRPAHPPLSVISSADPSIDSSAFSILYN